jgi:hypothetical protein
MEVANVTEAGWDLEDAFYKNRFNHFPPFA